MIVVEAAGTFVGMVTMVPEVAGPFVDSVQLVEPDAETVKLKPAFWLPKVG